MSTKSTETEILKTKKYITLFHTKYTQVFIHTYGHIRNASFLNNLSMSTISSSICFWRAF